MTENVALDWRSSMAEPCTCGPNDGVRRCDREDECYEAWCAFRAAESSAPPISAEQRLSDIENRLLQAKIDVLHGRGTTPPMWDDVLFLIDHLKGWRNLADSWARENDKLRAAARNEGVNDAG